MLRQTIKLMSLIVMVMILFGCAHPLIEASLSGDLASVENLIQTVEYVDEPRSPKYRITALMFAARRGHLDVAKKLVEAGASVHAIDSSGNTAFMHAADAGRTEVARFLLEQGSDINARDHYGYSALHSAAWRDKYYRTNNTKETIRLLINKGADVNVRAADGKTPLYIATTYTKDEAITSMLREAGAKLNPMRPIFKQSFSVMPPDGESWKISEIGPDKIFLNDWVNEKPYAHVIGAEMKQGMPGSKDQSAGNRPLLMLQAGRKSNSLKLKYKDAEVRTSDQEFKGRECVSIEWKTGKYRDPDINLGRDQYVAPGKDLMYEGTEMYCAFERGMLLIIHSSKIYTHGVTPESVSNETRTFLDSLNTSL